MNENKRKKSAIKAGIDKTNQELGYKYTTKSQSGP